MATELLTENAQFHGDDHKKHIGQFRDRFEDIKKDHPFHRLGGGQPGPDDYFIPESEIEKTLMKKRYVFGLLADVSETGQPSPRLVDAVFSNCSIGFCILLVCGAGRFIELFAHAEEYWDKYLPFRAKPTFLPDDIWTMFDHVQKRFKPRTLDGALPRSWDKDAVIPFMSQAEIGRGTSAFIYQVKLHHEYDHLQSQRLDNGPDALHDTLDKEYAVKVYRGRNAESYFNTETEVFQAIKDSHSQDYPLGIIEYLGAYQYKGGEAYCVILELASGGSLRQMFEKIDPPDTPSDILQFWNSLFDLLQGLTALHELQDTRQPGSMRHLTQRIHHDIHPDNIVLIPLKAATSSQYALRFRYTLADLGHSSTVDLTDRDALPYVPDTKAGVEYAAPEVCSSTQFQGQLNNMVSSMVDIFSLGAVFLEAAIWLLHGINGLREFTSARRRECQEKSMANHHFHTNEAHASELLDVVREHVEGDELKNHIQGSDYITLRVIEQLIERMLSPSASDRPRAKLTWKDCQRLLRQGRDQRMKAPLVDTDIAIDGTMTGFSPDEELPRKGSRKSTRGPSSPLPMYTDTPKSVHYRNVSNATIPSVVEAEALHGTPDPQTGGLRTPISMHTARGVHSLPEHPPRPAGSTTIVTINDVLEIARDSRSWLRRTLTPSSKLPMEHTREHLRDRDFIFLVDNSTSMGRHKLSVRDTLEAMLFVVSDADRDGVELYFTSDMKKKRSRARKPLIEMAVGCTYRGNWDMQSCLDVLFAKCRDGLQRRTESKVKWLGRPSQGTSIYVLTDGKWRYEGVKRLIVDTAHEINSRGYGREDLCVSFITFGDDREALAQIHELDELEKSNEAELDLVDAEHYTGDYWKMLLGALDPDRDELDTLRRTLLRNTVSELANEDV